MGFFKNIGKTIKKASKQITLKKVIGLASSLDPTGISGGVFASIEAKKEEKRALEQQRQAQLEYDKQIALQNEQEAERQKQLMEIAQQNAEKQRMLIATNTQAVGGKIGIVAGSIGGQITQSALQTANEQINQDLQTGLAKAGASMGNKTLNEWLKVHWWKLLLLLIALGFGLRWLIGGKRR